MKPNYDSLPAELTTLRQWVLWKTIVREGGATKVPFQPNGKPAATNADPTKR